MDFSSETLAAVMAATRSGVEGGINVFSGIAAGVYVPFATIYVVTKAIKAWAEERPPASVLIEISLVLGMVSWMASATTYKQFMGNYLWNGVVDEMVGQMTATGKGGSFTVDTAVGAMIKHHTYESSLEAVDESFLTKLKESIEKAGGAAMALLLKGMNFTGIVTGAIETLVNPLLVAGLSFCVMAAGFYLMVGPLFIVFAMLDLTRPWFHKWFAAYVGSLFGLVAIAFFIPMLAAWPEWMGTIAKGSLAIGEPIGGMGGFGQIVWTMAGIMAALKAQSIGKALFA